MTCQHCTVALTGRMSKYCGDVCSRRAYNARRKADGRLAAYRQREHVKQRNRERLRQAQYTQTFECKRCGAAHTNRRGEQSRYCSRVCATAHDTCAVPDTHPSRSSPIPPDHPSRWFGASSTVVWSDCAWCERRTPGPEPARYCSDSHRWAAKAVRRRGRQAAAIGTYTWADVMRLFLKFDRCCAYCLLPVDGQPDPDHVIPLSRGGGNTVSNLLPACRRCNSEKRDLTPHEWIEWRASTGRSSLPFNMNDPRWNHLALTSAARARAA